MNILFYRYDSICEPDIIAGFKTLGHNVTEITEEIYNKKITPAEGVEIVKHALFKGQYDFVFSVNFYPFISEVCNIIKIRYLCWTVDSPVLELYASSVTNPWNRIFLFDLAQYETFHPLNPDCVFHMPLASNPARWNHVITSASPAQVAHFSKNVAFVGSLYTEKCPYDELKDAPAYLTGFLEGIMSAQQKIYGHNFIEEVLPDEIVLAFKAHHPNFYIAPETATCSDRTIMAQKYIDVKISAMERLHTMKLLGSRYQVDLYTGSDTTGLPVINHGFANTLTEMPLIFHNSKINLNMTSKSIHSGIPLRVFDVLGCEGFLITNYQAELPEYFSLGNDLEYYTTDDELLAKVDYYLCHESDRREIAHNGLECVLKYHNYPERLLDMIALAYGITGGKE